MGLGPIPWSVRADYAEFHGLDEDNALAFVQIIGAMDVVYLTWKKEEMEAEQKSKK